MENKDDVLKKKIQAKKEEGRESVRGKLVYYQELIHQKEKEKREEAELQI